MFIDENAISERIQVLQGLISLEKHAIAKAPQGMLRIDSRSIRKSPQFYIRRDSSDHNGTYVSSDQRSLAKAIAQRQYDEQVLKTAESELAGWKKILTSQPKKFPENVYASLSQVRQSLVKPISLLDEEYVEKWRNEPFKHLPFKKDDRIFTTDRGERVRSKSELIIANTLNRHDIIYMYEKPIKLKGFGIRYPDFTILLMPYRVEIRWEHLGMMDDPDYVEKQIQKIEEYELSGLFPGKDLLITWETGSHPLDTKILETIIHHYFLDGGIFR